MPSLKTSIFLALFFLVPVGFLVFGFDFSRGAEEAPGTDNLSVGEVLTDNARDSLETTAGNKAVSGINVGGLLIPSSLNKKGIEFIELLQSKGNFPIVVEPGTAGKENIFKK